MVVVQPARLHAARTPYPFLVLPCGDVAMSSALASFAVLLLVVVSIPLVLWLVKRLS